MADLGLAPFLSLYGAWENGFLWAEGGISRQPAIYIQAMSLISAEINRLQEEKQKQEKGSTPPPTRIPKRAMKKLR